jgi:hypothetical protein
MRNHYHVYLRTPEGNLSRCCGTWMGFTRSGSIDFIGATGAFLGAIQAGKKVSGIFSPSLRTTAGMQCRLKPELLRSLVRFGAAAALDVGVISLVERRPYCALSVQKGHGIDLDQAARRQFLHFHRQSGRQGGRAQIAPEEIAVRAREA